MSWRDDPLWYVYWALVCTWAVLFTWWMVL